MKCLIIKEKCGTICMTWLSIKYQQNTYYRISKFQYKLIYCIYPYARDNHFTKDNIFKSGLADLEVGFWVASGQVQIFFSYKKNRNLCKYLDRYSSKTREFWNIEHCNLKLGKLLKQMHLNIKESQYNRNLIINVIIDILEIW